MHGSRFRFQVPVPVSLYRCIAVSLFSSRLVAYHHSKNIPRVSQAYMATTKKRYSDTTIQRYRNRNLEPEPGTVHNLCKLEHFAPQEIYIIIIYRGGGAQFNDSIKYYMQGIFMFKLLTVTKQRMNIRCSTTW